MRGVIRFLQADEILGYLAEEASSRVKFFCCTTIHVRILPAEPGTVELFPVSKNEGAL